MIRPLLKTILAGLLLAPVPMAAQTPLDEVVEALENQQMRRLAAQQNRPGIFIERFDSDVVCHQSLHCAK